MSYHPKTARLLLTAAAILILCSGPLKAQTIFSDDFHRSDGVVGNGWSSWWGSSYDHPNISLLNGELITRGYPNQAGGIYRTLPVTFPIVFSFDFRTPLVVGDNQCSSSSDNEGGWLIAFNASAPSSLPPFPPHNPAQLMFYQYAGSRNVGRSYRTAGGTIFDAAPGLPEPVAGQRDYQLSPAHIEGVVNPDLSATITIRYNDGQTPDPVTVTFGPASAPVSTSPGSVFVLGNSSCNTGQQIFDNLRLSVPTLPAQLDDSSQTAAAFGWRYNFGKGLSGTFDTLALKASVSGCVPYGANLTEWADPSYSQLVTAFDPAERVYVDDGKPWNSDPSTWTHDVGVMEWRWNAPITFNPEHYYAIGGSNCGDQSRRITFRTGTGDKGFGDFNGDPTQDIYFAFSRPSADLSISMTASPNPVVAGSRITYAITVTNSGPDAARGVTIIDNLPDATFFSSCSPAGAGVCGGSANNRTVTFQSIGAGESKTIFLYATVKCSAAGTTVSNTAAVSSQTSDPDPGNNSATAATSASAPPQGATCPALPAQLDDPSQTALVYPWRYTFGTGLVGTFDRLALEAGVYDCVPHGANLTEWADASYTQLVATFEPDERVYTDDGKPWSLDSSTWRHDVGVMEWRWNTPITFNPEHYYALGPADCGDQSRRIAFRMSADDKGFGDFNGDPGQDIYFLFSRSGESPLPCAPAFKTQLASKTVLVGQSATLTTDVSGSGLSYQWYSGASGDRSHPIGGATGSSYTTPAQSGLSRKQYWVRARNNCGAADSEAATVVITDKRPLIFIPGIAGSELSEIGGGVLWPGSLPRASLCLYDGLTLDPNKTQVGITPTDAIRNTPTGGAVYADLLARLASEHYREQHDQTQTLFVFAYDWRRPNLLAAVELNNLINNVRAQYPDMDVDILAHSMGGMVAQRYIFDHSSSHHVHKVITVGTPWLGAPKAINVLETGQFLEPLFNGVFFCSGTIKKLAEYFQGMHELIPSATYFTHAGRIGFLPPFKEAGWDIDGNGNAFEDYDYAKLTDMLDGRYPHVGSKPGTTNAAFHGRPGQDDGRAAPANIWYYHFYGNQRSAGTIEQVIAKRSLLCHRTGVIFPRCSSIDYIDLKMTHGDGTVPVVSATRLGTENLNEPNHQLIPVVGPDHLGLVNNGAAFDQIVQALSASGPISLSAQSSAAPVTDTPSYYLRTLGPASITVADAFGHSATLAGDSPDAAVPGVTAYIMGSQAFMTVLATDQTYTVTFKSSAEPVSIMLTRGTEDSTTEAVRYLDLTLPANVTAQFTVTPQGVGELRYDDDGDGTFETTVPPTAKASGDAAQDTDPPAVAVSSVFQGNDDLVTVNSSDSGSSVKATYYSLDGTSFQAYTSPLVVDPRQSPVVYAFADDNLANRSGVVTYTLPIPEPTPTPTPAPSSISSVSGSGVYNGTVTLTATLTAGGSGLSGKTVSFTLNNTSAGSATTDSNGLATLTNVSLSGINAGTYSNAVGANFAGDTTYSSSSGTGSLSVSKATAGVTLGGLSQTYDGVAKSATATTTPVNLNVTFTYSQNGQAVQAPTNAGSYGVTATVNNSNYQGTAAGTLVISKAGSTTTISVSNVTYDSQPHGGTAAASGAGGLSQSLTVTYSGRNTTTYGPSTAAPTNAGDYTASASFGGDSNHTASSDSKSYSISKASQTITVGTPAPSVAAYNTSFMVAAGASSGLPVTYGSSGTCTNVGATFTMISSAGTCTVSYGQAGNSNYDGAPQVTETVTARKVDQSITFTPLANRTFGDADISISATASSGLSVSFAASGQCIVTGSTVHLTGAGSCTVTASQSGDSNYNAAADVQQSFSIGKISQAVTFGALADKTFGDPDFSVTAAANSGLPVSFSASGACTVGGDTVHTVGAGGCTITASQGGDANHSAAADVAQSFQIAKAATATSLSSSANPATFGQSVTFTATITSGAGTPIGSVQFKSDGVSVGTPVALNAGGVAALTTSGLAAGMHTITADYGGDSNFSGSTSALSGGQTVGGVVEFSRATFTISERDGSVTVAVKRTGDTTQPMGVGYFTDDGSDPSVPVPCSTVTGIALERCDYTRAEGTLQFAAGETEKTFVVLVNDDSYVDGTEVTHLRLSSPADEAAIGQQSSATLQILDDTQQSSNPIDDSQAFVRQHYHDFLNREPDASGLQFWTDNIESCGSDAACREVKRIDTSAAFFLSIEFQETGYLVYRAYKVAYGDAASPNVPGLVPGVRLKEFLRDTQQIGLGVQVGIGNWQQQLEDNKNAYALDFVGRQRFRSAYSSTMTADEFVTRLDQNAGGVLSADERTQLIATLGSNPADAAKRAQVLRSVAETQALRQRESNRAFVLMQYFGYLRRNPDDAPDSDFRGWKFWLDKLDQFGGNFRSAEMVKAFIISIEYRQRFAP